METPRLTVTRAQVEIPHHGLVLAGDLVVPTSPLGLVVFAHGSGSSRFSPRNRFVAEVLQGVGMGTLLLDLLTPAEEAEDSRTAALRFDIELLAERLEAAMLWAAARSLPLGLFGASTGAGAALVAASRQPQLVRAVVSRGGRPDLAGRRALQAVQAPTRLIVGGLDHVVLRLNSEALSLLRCPCDLTVVPGATHLFEEPGTLEQAASLAADWFQRYLAKVRP